MDESTKSKVHQVEIIAAIVLLFVGIVSFFPNPGITGFVSVESKKQIINLTIVNSQSYILTTNSAEPFHLTSLRLSGDVIGEGIAKAYISTKDQNILIYSNVVKNAEGISAVTGMKGITGNVVGVDSESEGDSLIIEHLENIEGELGVIQEGETIVKGNFENICVDSCFMDMLLHEGIAYQLLFYVEEGTVLNINEMSYTIRKD